MGLGVLWLFPLFVQSSGFWTVWKGDLFSDDNDDDDYYDDDDNDNNHGDNTKDNNKGNNKDNNKNNHKSNHKDNHKDNQKDNQVKIMKIIGFVLVSMLLLAHLKRFSSLPYAGF